MWLLWSNRNPVPDLDRGDLPSGKRRSKPRYLTVAQVESIFGEMTDAFRPVAAGFDRIRPEVLVFQTSSGKSPGRRNALRALQTAAVKVGLVKNGQEPVGLHDLRHSLASNSFALGLTDVEVARLLRHANPRVTLTVYADLVEDEASTRLGRKLTAEGFGR